MFEQGNKVMFRVHETPALGFPVPKIAIAANLEINVRGMMMCLERAI